MKKTLIIASILWAQTSFSQFQEVSVGAGFAYYYGDLNTTNLERGAFTLLGESLNMKNFKLSASLSYRYNFKSMFSIGVNYYYMNLAGYDSDNEASNPSDAGYGRKLRNLSFHTAVSQGFVDFRIEPFRNAKQWAKSSLLLSPYFGFGLGFFQFNPKTIYNGREVELQPLGTEGQGLPGYKTKYRTTDIVIPMNLGLKCYLPSRKIALSIDFNYNHTFTDYIDDVSDVYADPLDFQNAYQATDPVKYELVSALSDRSVSKNAPGSVRGHTNNDFFLTGQIKFSYFLDGAARKYYCNPSKY